MANEFRPGDRLVELQLAELLKAILTRQRSIWTRSALRPVLQTQLNIDALITHRFPLSQAQEAFRTAAEDASAVKVMVVPD